MFDGAIVAFKVIVSPLPSVVDVLSNFMLLALTDGSFTVTLQVAVLPLFVFAVIIAVPSDFAVIIHPDTVAIRLSFVVQVTVLSFALSGITFAVSVSEFPLVIVVEVLFSFIPVTSTIVS